jgi:hypothetical protein
MNGHADYADRKDLNIEQKDQIISLTSQAEKSHYFNLKV